MGCKMRNYKSLQNGSDIRGVAIYTPDGPTVNLTGEVAERIALGFLLFLHEKTGGDITTMRIAVGRDSRLSGPAISKAVCNAMAEAGADIMDAGLASTPAMFMSTVFPEFDADGAIMITASHMPPDRNGLKFFSKMGGLEKQDISRILELAETESLYEMLNRAPEEVVLKNHKEEKNIRTINLMERYASHLREIIVSGLGEAGVSGISDMEKPLLGLKITVDAGNGAGGFYAEDVLSPLGADVSSSQFLEPDGNFPNHIPNPEDRSAMESISKRVLEKGTDLGLIFDTDVDRASAVDEKGNEIAHNGIVALAAALIADKYPGTTVVTDSVTSNQLTDFLEKGLKLKHLRYKRGYRNVIGKAMELDASGTDSQLAIETSGHAAFKQNYYLDDGAYLATLIVIKTAELYGKSKGISEVIAGLKEAKEKRELRLSFNNEKLSRSGKSFSEVGDEIIRDLTELAKSGEFRIEKSGGRDDSEGSGGQEGAPVKCSLAEPNYEGVRIDFPDEDIDGWMLLRKSLHDPIMPLNMEAMSEGGCLKISELLKSFLMAYPELDIEKL